MRFFKKTKGGLLLLIGLMVLILGVRFPKLITAPNDWVIGDSHDGFRSYAAAYFHVKHDSTYQHFEGMHYPYGDVVGFTDNLPLLANTVKFITNNVVDISDYTGGALNLFLLLSVLLCSLFLFLIFKHLGLPNWYIIPVAIGLTFLSPQIGRLGAHYGLAHPFVIPLVFYLSLVFHERRDVKTSLLIAAALFLISQIHLYLFAVGVLFIGGLMGFKTLFRFNKKELVFNVAHLAIQVVLPYLVLQFLINDMITDRPSRPYGFMVYRSYWENVFLPLDFQIGRWINTYIAEIRPMSGEGKAYIGIVASIFFFKEIAAHIKNLIQKKSYHSIIPEDHRYFMKSAFWASFVLLVFSFGIPFIIHGWENLPYKLGPIGQFRSVGRFAWVFFYVINIITFYALYFQLKNIKRVNLRIPLLVLVLGVLNFEGITFLFTKNKITLFPNPELRENFRKADNPWLDSIDISEYQAIIPLPHFHQGSENFWRISYGHDMHRSMWASVQTGLPITGAFLGRTSVSQTINELELVAEPYRIPAIFDDLPNDKAFLVFLHKKSYAVVWYRFNHLLFYLPAIYEDDQIKLYKLTIEEIERSIEKRRQNAVEDFEQLKLFRFENILSKDSVQNFIYQNFDDQKASKYYRGNGFEGIGNNENIIFEGQIPNQKAKQRYVFSIWAYMKEDLYPKSMLTLKEFDAQTGEEIQKRVWGINHDIRSYDGDWALIDTPFELESTSSILQFSITNSDLEDRKLYFDEFQIRLQEAKLFREFEDELMFNNRFYNYQKDEITE